MKIIKSYREYAYEPFTYALEKFKSSADYGLLPKQVIHYKKQYGANRLSTNNSLFWLNSLKNQFCSLFFLVFMIAGLAFLAIGEYINGLIILIFIIINTLIGFYQEFRANRTLQLLARYITTTVMVLRQGKVASVQSPELVPGDIILLEEGLKIPADIRLINQDNLIVDESSLTGESAPVSKNAQALPKKSLQDTITEITTICFAGTTIVGGRGKGIVIATGSRTVMGSIAQLSNQTSRESSLIRGSQQLSRFLVKLIIITLVCVMGANLLFKKYFSFTQLLIFSTTLALSAIPEALPLVITFCLAQGVMRLIKHKVIVKRFSAIEDFGAIDILCVDKTGTITENDMHVCDVYGSDKDELILLSLLGGYYQTATKGFDKAIFHYASTSVCEQLKDYDQMQEIPFIAARRRNSMLVQDANKELRIIVRGSPEDILACCIPLETQGQKAVDAWIQEQGLQGRRILLIASKKLTKKSEDLKQEENHLLFIGGISFVDPLKPTTYKAVQKAKQLHVKIKMLSGDSKEVCGSVAHAIGLIDDMRNVVTGQEWQAMSAEKKQEIVLRTDVFARILPEQKYEIIHLLQNNFIVGYIGDGINDAPALKVAHVSLAVHGASDIASDAADILLLKDNLMVIINGIEEGRKVVINTMKYLKTTLSTTFGNFYALAITSLFIDYLPMLPMQVLLINILTDFPLIAISTDTIDRAELRYPKRYDISNLLLITTLFGMVSNIFDFICFAFFVSISPGVLQTSWFIMSVLTGLVFIFSIRSQQFFLQASRPSWILLFLSFLIGCIAVVLPSTYVGTHYMQFTPLNRNQYIIIFILVTCYFITTEMVKWFYYRRFNNQLPK